VNFTQSTGILTISQGLGRTQAHLVIFWYMAYWNTDRF
jgi:hypothetical protein